jgi:hypothetical protein
MARPVRLRHAIAPWIAMPEGGGFHLALQASVGYDLTAVDHWLFELAPRTGAEPRSVFDSATVAITGQVLDLHYDLADAGTTDTDLTISDVADFRNCEWGITAYDADDLLLWRVQGDLDFESGRGNPDTGARSIGSPIEIDLGEGATLALTILGESQIDALDAAGLAALIHAGTAKSTPADNDAFGIVDSAASNGFKKVLWSAIKATLKTYFDTIYTTTSAVATQISTAISAAASSYATAAQGTKADTALQPSYLTEQTLSDGATVTYNVANGVNAKWTIGGDRTLSIPTNVAAGQSGRLVITQDATGGRALTLASGWGLCTDNLADVAAMTAGKKCVLSWTAMTSTTFASTLIFVP